MILRFVGIKKRAKMDKNLKKRPILAVLMALVLAGGLFAEEKVEWDFPGDELNKTIRNYVIHVSNLVPDSTTLSNTWSRPPSEDWLFGLGLSGSAAFLSSKETGRFFEKGAETFGGKHTDITKFPEAVPFLPGGTIDFRVGKNRLDVGIAGMWFDNNTLAFLAKNFGENILGDSSNYTLRSIGFDVRYALIVEEEDFITPAVTLQGGYYYTSMGFGIRSGQEKVSVDLRNDSYFLAAQVSKTIIILTPYIGTKLLLSKTVSGFEWETNRPVMLGGQPYPDGGKYVSGAKQGNLAAYFILYGGLGFSFPLKHIVTLGGAYNVTTNHFGANVSVRLTMGEN